VRAVLSLVEAVPPVLHAACFACMGTHGIKM